MLLLHSRADVFFGVYVRVGRVFFKKLRKLQLTYKMYTIHVCTVCTVCIYLEVCAPALCVLMPADC